MGAAKKNYGKKKVFEVFHGTSHNKCITGVLYLSPFAASQM
jgi:hypothetical protein